MRKALPTTCQLFVLAIVSKHGPDVAGSQVRENLALLSQPRSLASFYQLMARVVSQGWVTSARDGDGSTYSITAAGEGVLDTFCTRLESVRA